jgi:hypothetical protein
MVEYTTEDKKFWYELTRGEGGHRYDQRAPDWFGYQIAKRLGLKARSNPEQKKEAAQVLEALIEEGVLDLQRCKDGRNGRRVVWVVAGAWADTTNG